MGGADTGAGAGAAGARGSWNRGAGTGAGLRVPDALPAFGLMSRYRLMTGVRGSRKLGERKLEG